MAKRSSSRAKSAKNDYGAPKTMYAYGGEAGESRWCGSGDEPESMYETVEELDNHWGGMDAGDIIAVYQLVGYKKIVTTRIGLEDA